MAIERNKCLCYFPPRNGSIAIGIGFMMFAVATIIYCISIHEHDEDLGRFHTIIWTARVSLWLGQITNFILSGLMVYGVVKEKEQFLVWWLWYVGIVGCCVGTLGIGFVLMFLAFQMNIAAIVGSAVLAVGTVLVIHCIRVVHSYRVDLMVAHSLPTVILDKSAVPIVTTPNKEYSPPRYIPLK